MGVFKFNSHLIDIRIRKKPYLRWKLKLRDRIRNSKLTINLISKFKPKNDNNCTRSFKLSKYHHKKSDWLWKSEIGGLFWRFSHTKPHNEVEFLSIDIIPEFYLFFRIFTVLHVSQFIGGTALGGLRSSLS